MASTTTPLIGLYQAIPGTNEPFRAEDINNNWDILDTFIVNYEDRFTELSDETAAALATFTETSTALLAEFTATNEAAADALEQFELDSAEAIAALDTDAIISAIITEEFSLDIDGGSA